MKKKLLTSIALVIISYTNAQVATINENFASPKFSDGALPQNNWTSDKGFPFASIANQTVQLYSLMSANVPIHIVTPELISINSTYVLKFDAGFIAGSASTTATFEYGTTTAPASSGTPLTVFNKVGNITLASGSNTYTVNLPSTSDKYIVFKYIPASNHTAAMLDNVMYGPDLAVNDVKTNIALQFAISNNNIVFGAKGVNTVKIYSATGSLVSEGKVINEKYDVSRLNTGTYFISLTTDNGVVKQSKFIKK